jgi:GNAT superfamily N-acetyltransferase
VPYEIQALTKARKRDAFDCGEPALNEFLQKHARQNQERGVGRTFVVIGQGDRSLRVVGFYTLSAGRVEFENVPDALRKGLPRYPVPVAHLGRLGVCRSAQGQKLGEALLIDALDRICGVAEEIGIAAIEVWAKNERARSFYARYGFAGLLDDGVHMYMPIQTARKALGS